MLALLGQTIAAVGAIVALFGTSWSPQASGWRRITLRGRLSLAIILCGFAVSTTGTLQQIAREKSHAQQDLQLQAAAAKDLTSNLNALLYPFTTALWEVDGHSSDYSPATLQRLSQPATWDLIGTVNLLSDAPHYQGTWLHVISSATKNGREGLLSAEARYSSFLDRQLLLDIREVADSQMLSDMAVAEEAFSSLRGSDRQMPFHDLSAPKFYFAYLKALRKLQADLAKYLPRVDEGS